jgi:hypothetical protein
MCVRCRRNLLAGESYRHWESAGRSGARVVCGLCERDAALAGWARLSPVREREPADGLRWTVRLVA